MNQRFAEPELRENVPRPDLRHSAAYCGELGELLRASRGAVPGSRAPSDDQDRRRWPGVSSPRPRPGARVARAPCRDGNERRRSPAQVRRTGAVTRRPQTAAPAPPSTNPKISAHTGRVAPARQSRAIVRFRCLDVPRPEFDHGPGGAKPQNQEETFAGLRGKCHRPRRTVLPELPPIRFPADSSTWCAFLSPFCATIVPVESM